MSRYRKKPVEVEAWQVGSGDPMPEWLKQAEKNGLVHVKVGRYDYWNHYIFIKTLEGEIEAKIGDYIIRGVNGELYPCKPDIFEQNYEPIES